MFFSSPLGQADAPESCMNAPRLSVHLLAAVLAMLLFTDAVASDGDVAELRAMLEDMRVEYEQRIKQLEGRLATAEREAREEARRANEYAKRRQLRGADHGHGLQSANLGDLGRELLPG